MGDPAEPIKVYSAILVAFYALICLIACIQLSRLLYYRHHLRSFYFAFLALVFVWNILRVLFFTQHWSEVVTYIIYWFPVDIQFATFSLLVVYYASRVYTQQRLWEQRKRLVTTMYVLGNVSVFFLTSMYIVIGCKAGQGLPEGECDITGDLDSAHHVYMAIQFFMLTVMFAAYASKLRSLQRTAYLENGCLNWGQGSGGGGGGRGTSPMDVLLTLLAFLLFASRCLYNIMVVVGVDAVSVQDPPHGIKKLALPAFLLYMIWEVLPTWTLLWYFGRQTIKREDHRRCCCFGTNPAEKFVDDSDVEDFMTPRITDSPYSPWDYHAINESSSDLEGSGRLSGNSPHMDVYSGHNAVLVSGGASLENTNYERDELDSP